MSAFNACVAIRNFLESKEKPIDIDEFAEFWFSLSPDELDYYRQVEIQK